MAIIRLKKWYYALLIAGNLMTVSAIILFLSLIVWLLPPFKSVNTRYFYFFFVLGVIDPIRVFAGMLFHYNSPFLTILATGLLVITLLDFRKQQYIVAAFSAALAVIYYSVATPVNYIMFCTILFNLGIILIISVRIINHLKENKSLNLFLVLLLSYELITVFRKTAILLDLQKGAISFMLGGAIQILFGIAFIFINVNTKSFKLVKEKAGEIEEDLSA